MDRVKKKISDSREAHKKQKRRKPQRRTKVKLPPNHYILHPKTEQQQLFTNGTVIAHPTNTVKTDSYICPCCGAPHHDNNVLKSTQMFYCRSCKKQYKYPTPAQVRYVAPTTSDNIPIEEPDWK